MSSSVLWSNQLGLAMKVCVYQLELVTHKSFIQVSGPGSSLEEEQVEFWQLHFLEVHWKKLHYSSVRLNKPVIVAITHYINVPAL